MQQEEQQRLAILKEKEKTNAPLNISIPSGNGLNDKISIVDVKDSAGNDVKNGGYVVSVCDVSLVCSDSPYGTLTFIVQFSSTLLKDNPSIATNAWSSKQCVIDGKAIDYNALNNPCGGQDWRQDTPPNSLTTTKPLDLRDQLGIGHHTIKINAVESGDPTQTVQSSNTFSWNGILAPLTHSILNNTMTPTYRLSNHPNGLNGKIVFNNTNYNNKPSLLSTPHPAIIGLRTIQKSAALPSRASSLFVPGPGIVRADIKCLPSCRVYEGQTVTLDGSGSSPLGGTYSWSSPWFPGGGTQQQLSWSGPIDGTSLCLAPPCLWHSSESAPSFVTLHPNGTGPAVIPFKLQYCYPPGYNNCYSNRVEVTIYPGSVSHPKQTRTPFLPSNLSPSNNNNNPSSLTSSSNNNNMNNNPSLGLQQQPSSSSQNNLPPTSNNPSSSSSSSGNNNNTSPSQQSSSQQSSSPSTSTNNNNQQQVNPCVLNPETSECTPH